MGLPQKAQKIQKNEKNQIATKGIEDKKDKKNQIATKGTEDTKGTDEVQLVTARSEACRV